MDSERVNTSTGTAAAISGQFGSREVISTCPGPSSRYGAMSRTEVALSSTTSHRPRPRQHPRSASTAGPTGVAGSTSPHATANAAYCSPIRSACSALTHHIAS